MVGSLIPTNMCRGEREVAFEPSVVQDLRELKYNKHTPYLAFFGNDLRVRKIAGV